MPNDALDEEITSINAIYDSGTLEISSEDETKTVTTLRLSENSISFLLSFPSDYPDVPPNVDGTASVANHTKGEGKAAVEILGSIISQVWTPGQVCLFEVIEEARSRLVESATQQATNKEEEEEKNTTSRNHGPTTTPPNLQAYQTPHQEQNKSVPTIISSSSAASHNNTNKILLDPSNFPPSDFLPSPPIPPPLWTQSEPLTTNKSTFLAHVAPCKTKSQATAYISELLSTNKKLASATHNISAWRLRGPPPPPPPAEKSNNNNNNTPTATTTTHGNTPPLPSGTMVIVQDSDDDGETAAGGRLLHLMQLMDVWNVVVVVTRWYGGVKLGPERFRCINAVAREALVKAGFLEGEGIQQQQQKKKKGKK